MFRAGTTSPSRWSKRSLVTAVVLSRPAKRLFQLSTSGSPKFAFAFDIDGVLCRSSEALPGAAKALRALRKHNIPFILLTNGGGKTERARVEQLSQILDITISTSQFVQSHTPFDSFSYLKNKNVLVVGGPKDGHSCRLVAESYGFKFVITPLDIYAAYPDIWPFGPCLSTKLPEHIRPLPYHLAPHGASAEDLDPTKHLRFDAVFVYNDPRAWSLDCSILLDTLLSHAGYIGTLSSKNGMDSEPNRGYLQDGQPRVYFSNPDILWAAKWPHPRLGQGAFRAAFEGVWHAATGGASLLNIEQWGKPFGPTYSFAEERLHQQLDKGSNGQHFETVYMVGDNPESDIRGANEFVSKHGTQWRSVLVRSGVYSGGEPTHKPKLIVDGIWDAVQIAFQEQNLSGQRTST